MAPELKPEQFSEANADLDHIFRAIEKELGREEKANGGYFYPHWRRLMELGVARTWFDSKSVLGALFVRDTFYGQLECLIHFLFTLPEARGNGSPVRLLKECEDAARTLGCKKISIASHSEIGQERSAQFHKRSGYSVSETIFSKKL